MFVPCDSAIFAKGVMQPFAFVGNFLTKLLSQGLGGLRICYGRACVK